MSNFTFKTEVRRTIGKRTAPDKIKRQITDIAKRSLNFPDGNGWQSSIKCNPPVQTENGWVFQSFIKYEKISGIQSGNVCVGQQRKILEYLKRAGTSASYGTTPWLIASENDPIVPLPEKESAPIYNVDFEEALSLDQLKQKLDENEILISGSDQEIEDHPAFKGIYGRGAHIRLLFSSIKRMVATKGQLRHHGLLYGKPGAAKSHVLMGMQNVLGSGAFLILNSNTTTKAGVAKLFKRLSEGPGIPKIVFIEELEKTKEEMLDIWLGIMDERAEIRKVNYREDWALDVECLVFATANDKRKLDMLHGGSPTEPGALSSRFRKKLNVPRPDENIMRRILLREIHEYGGDKDWIDPCIDLASEIVTDDPRIVLSFLDGGDRLLTGEYQQDILAVQEEFSEEE